MTRFKYLFGCGFMFLMASCIREEKMNIEAAIEACSGSNIELSDVNNDHTVVLFVQQGVDRSRINIEFQLADGATIQPVEAKNDSADYYDLTSPRYFKVTAEDGAHSVQYKVTAVPSEMPTEYYFDNLYPTEGRAFDVFYELNKPQKQFLKWCSGNTGFNLTAMAQSRTDFPTFQEEQGRTGKCLKLVTRDTGKFGRMVKMYLAAGNLFAGSFDLKDALSNAPKATKFGFPFFKIPVSLTGYYKYKAGPVYTRKGVAVDSIRDKCDIYAIMYKADNNSDVLDGTNAFTSPKLVLLAHMNQGDVVESDEWTYFSIPFETMNGKSIDKTDLAAGKYKLSVVFSSSVDGANFNGAVGSTMYVDDVKLNCREK